MVARVENAVRSLGGARPSLNQASIAAQGIVPTANATAPRRSRVRQIQAIPRQAAYRAPSFFVHVPSPAENPASASSLRVLSIVLKATANGRERFRGSADF